MKLAIAYNTRNEVELTKQTFPVLRDGQHALLWSDGSTDPEALQFFQDNNPCATAAYPNVVGGADSAIAHAFTRLLQHPARYTHVGLVESDVLLDVDWLAPTMALFEKGAADDLRVGAVSARSYEDRVLIQRDEYAVMLNVGAGMIVMTRDAAQIVLDTFRTAYWPATRKVFAQLSGIDVATFACFRGQEQFTTTDWQFEAQLARMGYATLALTPSKASMIGQVPPLHEQGLTLTQGLVEVRRNDTAFELYRENLRRCGSCVDGKMLSDGWPVLHREGSGLIIFPHQLSYIGAQRSGNWRLKNSQGFGPFAYRAGPGGASLSARISGSCSFLLSGGADGATVSLTDTRSGFKAEPQLPPEQGSFIEVNVPGGPVPREIVLQASEGAVFYGLQTVDPQMIDTTFKFDWSVLPEV